MTGRRFQRRGDRFQSVIPLLGAHGPVCRAYLLSPRASDQPFRLPGRVHPGALLGPVCSVEHSERFFSVLIPAVAAGDRRSGSRFVPPSMHFLSGSTFGPLVYAAIDAILFRRQRLLPFLIMPIPVLRPNDI